MDLKEEDILGDKIHEHWYYVSKGRAMRSFLGDITSREVLDVGSGSGSGMFSRQLLDDGICETSVCVDPNYEQEIEELHNGKKISFVKSIDKTTQKLVLMMDVLEHAEDDVVLLKYYADSMPDDGQILITVPAFQFLWSGNDLFLEHYRRYNISEIEKTIRAAGLEPVKSRYFFASLFPVVAAVRLLEHIFGKKKINKSQLKQYSESFNKTLITVHDMERNGLFSFNKQFGLSVFCLCKKA